MRANRFLGSALVESGLITYDHIDAANQKLLDYIKAENLRQASLLNILIYELQALKEDSLLNYIVQTHGLGLIDLSRYRFDKTFFESLGVDLELCWSTLTVPFDLVEGVSFLGTAYFLSVPIVEHWQETLKTNIVWYAAPISSVVDALEKLTPKPEDAKAPGAAAPPKA